MQRYEMVEKGQSNIKVTTNTVGGILTVYLLREDTDGNLTVTDITETDPTISNIADGKFEQYVFTAPNEDCYAAVIMNGKPQFFRVGSPNTKLLVYGVNEGLTINYSLDKFDGTNISSGALAEATNGIYYHTLTDVGDYIFSVDGLPPVPVHSNYILDVSSAKLKGTIRFEPDRWMLLSIPIAGKKVSDIITDIENKYGLTGSDMFRVFSAYPSVGTTQNSEFLDFVPGVTPTTTKYNFDLMYDDNGVFEITGFWVKTLPFDLSTSNYPDDTVVIYDWESNVE